MLRGGIGPGGETWYVAFTPVAVPGYILAVTVPEDDIREPFTTAQSNIESLVFMIVLAVFVVLVFIVSVRPMRGPCVLQQQLRLLHPSPPPRWCVLLRRHSWCLHGSYTGLWRRWKSWLT